MSSQIPPEILSELQKYKFHKKGTCLKCGYVGLLGIGKTPKLVYWGLNATVVVITGGFFYFILGWSYLTTFVINAILFTVIMHFFENSNLTCPQCRGSKYNSSPTQPLEQPTRIREAYTFDEKEGKLVKKE